MKTKFLAMFVGTAVFAIGSPVIAASKRLASSSAPHNEREFAFMAFSFLGMLSLGCCFAILADKNKSIDYSIQFFLCVFLMFCIGVFALEG
jgi:hypothetical protein